MPSKRPVTTSVPVNLRPFFNSVTTKNFFVMVTATFHPKAENQPFEDVIAEVKKSLREQITKEHLEEIDAQLNSASRGWKTKRMSRVDLAALRLAVYEMEYDADVPTGVAINEAVELAKRFGGDASGSFVNGVLGKIASEKDEKKNEEETADTEEKAAEAPEENA